MIPPTWRGGGPLRRVLSLFWLLLLTLTIISPPYYTFVHAAICTDCNVGQYYTGGICVDCPAGH
jgi:hypothetical protein